MQPEKYISEISGKGVEGINQSVREMNSLLTQAPIQKRKSLLEMKFMLDESSYNSLNRELECLTNSLAFVEKQIQFPDEIFFFNDF
ncbi:hypothetical protein CWO85_01765 [Candidatus Phytoplasma ziziphi]|uniref:Uncharacterized protein n=1 Tax=Ziziphus jujuba witches'-broom phytoplasma TaxID=135727 RepID=A0A660HMI6_ZIZJU|nr:hypothetical protein [Candidatus Phytoplasma ziziphi]AYJ01250.1 hypothetical protein CWO85_01765 [Candidatus Phytoplasma ziziphi]